MPSMSETRSRVSVCECSHFLYLCGDGSERMEVYDVLTMEFSRVEALLPEESACCVVLEKGELVVISGKYVSRYRVGKGGQLQQVGKAKHQKWEVGSNCVPVLSATGLVYLSWAGQCYSLKTDGTERIQVAN